MALVTSIVKHSDVLFICVFRRRLLEIFIESTNVKKRMKI